MGNILKSNASGPSPERRKNTTWKAFVRSIKSECLDRLVLFGERSLRHVVAEYMAHYHAERNHQGVDNRILFPDGRLTRTGRIKKSERLGGLLSFYHRLAA